MNKPGGSGTGRGEGWQRGRGTGRGWRGGRGNWRGGNPSYFKNRGRGFQGYRGSLFKLCIIKIMFLFLLTAVIILEPAVLCSVYGARNSKKTDMGGKWQSL